ncbi:hypothetical protein LCAZH_0934 [Lacticaseibacillus paracasei]|uniref:Uncharacterized protein n=2 Tax=Lacticaseibacillus paracasei subsp. paracasei TaxID=47714 RepID=S2NDP5_LACPA|nr:hypothetical protein LCAZH_0934 [Lacticaseibacillus paracasei]EEI66928.1 hypothetical protein HMPREF0530_2825 [Lacticaseibacillus paracasei subsp. paracasei ATCC 25302 = DSM 5622 = JCM 8130]EPC25944.1 hypothetical protein Lpp17_1243 [Lacticaseibacillus paracasei subsp. paracasei Lpp17]EPC27974.1 hypothetical protein Lpp46_0631 [Lacticaseibacillus paracasei subsp. paracasei Lpp46]EPC30630.1 hypothetical protein Lpp120_2235 [Lacticaseibacillus paracasei subsp. paracasei Lpp120]EPC38005.1 hypo
MIWHKRQTKTTPAVPNSAISGQMGLERGDGASSPKTGLEVA